MHCSADAGADPHVGDVRFAGDSATAASQSALRGVPLHDSFPGTQHSLHVKRSCPCVLVTGERRCPRFSPSET